MSVVVKNTSRLFGKQKALDHVSFEINKGEIVGFIGPNGAGKSTMMKIITGVIPPTEGEVWVNGEKVSEQEVATRRYVGYLPEANPLYNEMYVTEYLNHVAGLYHLGKKTKQRVEEIIKMTGLELERKKKIGQLSKGYKQRVGIAQALIHDPEVLILDEPTSGLDPNQIVEIRNLISKAGKEKTVMLSTHIMQEVEAICDRIIIINKGKIVANDTKDKVIRQNKEKIATIVVEFNQKVDEKELRKIEGVNKVKKMEQNQYLIQFGSEHDIRNDVFNFAVKKEIAVLSMQVKEKSLEEVFRELTR